MRKVCTFSQMRNMVVRHQTGFINSWCNLTMKIYLQISERNIGPDSAILSTILAQLRSHGWLKCTANEKKRALFPCRWTVRCTDLSMERVILRLDNHWAQDSVLISVVVSICGLVLGTLHWTSIQQLEKHSHWMYFLYFLRFWDRVQSKPWTSFDLNLAIRFLSFSQIIFLWCRRSVCPLRMALKVRENPLFLSKIWNPIIQCRNQLCPLRMALRTRLFPPIRWKWTLIFPKPVCYLRRSQTLSLFPHTRFSQWKFAYLLSRTDVTPPLTLSSTLYLPPYSLLPLTFPDFRTQSCSTRPPICPI
jgi:hypothetical protein